MRAHFRFAVLMCLGVALLTMPSRAQQWISPTPEELSMTSIPEVPGASAVYLYLEQTTDDHLRMFSYYTRVKVLTEAGRDLANVEIPYAGNAGISIDSVGGRTIHADGTIIPFTGKPYDKLVEKSQGYKFKEKLLTMPAVEVGSILEYRFKLHYDDSYFMHPDWYIQSKLFTRKAHYSWRPNGSDNTYIVGSHGETLGTVAWSQILPTGAKVQQLDLTGRPAGNDPAKTQIILDVADIPPLPHEEFMPPLDSVSYRVMFYYTSYQSSAEYWQKEGKYWSKDRDKFIGPGNSVKAAVKELIAAGDTQEQKLRKIYEVVTKLENTDFTRQRSSQEERAQGLKEATSTDDILNRKRGDGDQMTELFVAMARAAGLKAYVMGVADRTRRFFIPTYLNLRQLDDLVAIVELDGKERTFDPGQRYCTFNQVSWRHSYSGGLRQTADGVALSATSPEFYKNEHTNRVADLSLDERGLATGTVTMTYTGDAALRWRQQAARGDDTSLNSDLKASLERLLPGGMEVRVTGVENLTDAEKPLKIVYAVSGAVGSPTGKRLLVPANLFEASSRPRFPSPKRELAVDMQYPSLVQDAVRFKYPESIMVESAPRAEKEEMDGVAVFSTSATEKANTITLFRNLSIGKTIFLAGEYGSLRSFYNKVEAKDQEPLVLTRAAATPKAGGGAD